MQGKPRDDAASAYGDEQPTHISDLTPDPDNLRTHNPRNIGVIVDALNEVGAARSIVIDEENCVLAGNGVLEAAAEAGIERVRVIEADGDEIIAVRRRGLTPEQKKRLALYDNRAGELSEWDTAKLAAAFVADGAMAEKMWTEKEAATLKAALSVDGETPADEIKPGDLFALGEHRLMCGDTVPTERLDEWTAKPALDPFDGSNVVRSRLDHARFAVEAEPFRVRMVIDKWEQDTGRKSVKVETPTVPPDTAGG